MSAVALLPGARVVRLEPGAITTEVDVAPDSAVFAGHYPHFSILPGVFTLEAVHRAVERHAAEHGAGGPVLAGVKSARFAAPVLPGDTLTVDCTVKATDGGREVAATCSTARGRTGTYKLVYTDGGVSDVD